MKTLTGEAIGLETQPVALLWADEAPKDALRFKPGRWACVISVIAAAAAQGRTGAFDAQTYGCWGGGVGLGFGNCYHTFPGGLDCFCRFLSGGNAEDEKGSAVGRQMAAAGWGAFADDFLHGEKYQQSPEVTARFVEALPIREVPAKYVVVKPLSLVDPHRETPQSVTFFVDPDQLSALVVLANYGDPKGESVAIPWAAACQVMGILAYREAERERPRGLVGMTDLSARKNVRAALGPHVMSFTVPWSLFRRMESDAGDSFLQRETWKTLRS
ncbi:MAG: DUF169 domain-containing protein [Holophaga sp.]|jgi:uncharacterized protein (DUF169 family)